MTKILKMAIRWQQKWEFLSMRREGGGKKITGKEIRNLGIKALAGFGHTVVKL